MATEAQEYMNGLRPGPLTREIPECMRDKYTIIQTVLDVLAFLMLAIGHVIQAIYRSIVGVPKKDLQGTIALVTGGGGGLGSLIALRLARLGCVIVLWDINKRGLEDTVKLVKGLGGKCYGYVVDLASRDDIYRTAKQVEKDVGRVNLLINNAGVVSGKYLLDTPDHLIQRTFDVNVLAHFWTVKAFLPSMVDHNDGHIVTIASMAGHVGVAKLVDYCSSKSAACGFDEALRSELEVKGVKGVHTSLICPYFIRATGMFEEVNSRLVPTLSSNDVADRVILAIRTNETLAVIPAYFRLLLPFKWLRYFGAVACAMVTEELFFRDHGNIGASNINRIVPWACVSELIRGIIPDAVPTPMPMPEQETAQDNTAQRKGASRQMSLASRPARYDRQV